MRMLVVFMKLYGWKGKIIDVETAFLYGELNKEINMTIPRGLKEYKEKDLKDKCVLLKSLYMD